MTDQTPYTYSITIQPEPTGDERDAVLAALLASQRMSGSAGGEVEPQRSRWALAGRVQAHRIRQSAPHQRSELPGWLEGR